MPSSPSRPGVSGRAPFVSLSERGYALFAEPAGGKRPGGTCQSPSVPLPERGYALFSEPTGDAAGRYVSVTIRAITRVGAMLSSPSPPGVSGRAVRVSHHPCHYPSGVVPSSPSPPG
jgi:hypothetical protein